MQICTACCQQSKTPSSWWRPSHSSYQSKHKSIIEDSSSFRLYEKRILSNHSVFLFVLKPGSDGFCTSMHKGFTWSREYFELFTLHAFYMLFKFFCDDTNLTVTGSQPKFCILSESIYDVQCTNAANSTSSNLSENIDHLTHCMLKTAKWVVCQTVKTEVNCCIMWPFIRVYTFCWDQNSFQDQKDLIVWK